LYVHACARSHSLTYLGGEQQQQQQQQQQRERIKARRMYFAFCGHNTANSRVAWFASANSICPFMDARSPRPAETARTGGFFSLRFAEFIDLR
jgi:hypothetical protein